MVLLADALRDSVVVWVALTRVAILDVLWGTVKPRAVDRHADQLRKASRSAIRRVKSVVLTR